MFLAKKPSVKEIASIKNWMKAEVITLSLLAITLLIFGIPKVFAESGITDSKIRIGSVMDLQGDSSKRDLAVKVGIEAALKNEKIQGHEIEFIVLNHSFDPKIAVEATQQLISQGIFVMLGSVGSPMTKAIMPILAENKVPAVAFVTGETHLRSGVGEVINLRASTAQEFTSLIEAVITAGVKPREICFYIPDDATGISNLSIIKAILEKQPGIAEIIKKLEQIIAMKAESPNKEPNRNGIGPVGFYSRYTNLARDGYQSLKQWEQATNTRCRLVVTQGPFNPISNFIAYARYKNESWIISANSTTDADALVSFLQQSNVTDKVLMTQVMPSLDSSLPIVEEARKSLGSKLSYLSLEGFISGKMFLAIARSIKGDITRESFLKAARGHSFDLGGLPLDFTNDNQGSDLVLLIYLDGKEFKRVTPQQLVKIFQ